MSYRNPAARNAAMAAPTPLDHRSLPAPAARPGREQAHHTLQAPRRGRGVVPQPDMMNHGQQSHQQQQHVSGRGARGPTGGSASPSPVPPTPHAAPLSLDFDGPVGAERSVTHPQPQPSPSAAHLAHQSAHGVETAASLMHMEHAARHQPELHRPHQAQPHHHSMPVQQNQHAHHQHAQQQESVQEGPSARRRVFSGRSVNAARSDVSAKDHPHQQNSRQHHQEQSGARGARADLTMHAPEPHVHHRTQQPPHERRRSRSQTENEDAVLPLHSAPTAVSRRAGAMDRTETSSTPIESHPQMVAGADDGMGFGRRLAVDRRFVAADGRERFSNERVDANALPASTMDADASFEVTMEGLPNYDEDSSRRVERHMATSHHHHQHQQLVHQDHHHRHGYQSMQVDHQRGVESWRRVPAPTGGFSESPAVVAPSPAGQYPCAPAAAHGCFQSDARSVSIGATTAPRDSPCPSLLLDGDDGYESEDMSAAVDSATVADSIAGSEKILSTSAASKAHIRLQSPGTTYRQKVGRGNAEMDQRRPMATHGAQVDVLPSRRGGAAPKSALTAQALAHHSHASSSAPRRFAPTATPPAERQQSVDVGAGEDSMLVLENDSVMMHEHHGDDEVHPNTHHHRDQVAVFNHQHHSAKAQTMNNTGFPVGSTNPSRTPAASVESQGSTFGGHSVFLDAGSQFLDGGSDVDDEDAAGVLDQEEPPAGEHGHATLAQQFLSRGAPTHRAPAPTPSPAPAAPFAQGRDAVQNVSSTPAPFATTQQQPQQQQQSQKSQQSQQQQAPHVPNRWGGAASLPAFAEVPSRCGSEASSIVAPYARTAAPTSSRPAQQRSVGRAVDAPKGMIRLASGAVVPNPFDQLRPARAKARSQARREKESKRHVAAARGRSKSMSQPNHHGPASSGLDAHSRFDLTQERKPAPPRAQGEDRVHGGSSSSSTMARMMAPTASSAARVTAQQKQQQHNAGVTSAGHSAPTSRDTSRSTTARRARSNPAQRQRARAQEGVWAARRGVPSPSPTPRDPQMAPSVKNAAGGDDTAKAGAWSPVNPLMDHYRSRQQEQQQQQQRQQHQHDEEDDVPRGTVDLSMSMTRASSELPALDGPARVQDTEREMMPPSPRGEPRFMPARAVEEAGMVAPSPSMKAPRSRRVHHMHQQQQQQQQSRMAMQPVQSRASVSTTAAPFTIAPSNGAVFADADLSAGRSELVSAVRASQARDVARAQELIDWVQDARSSAEERRRLSDEAVARSSARREARMSTSTAIATEAIPSSQQPLSHQQQQKKKQQKQEAPSVSPSGSVGRTSRAGSTSIFSGMFAGTVSRDFGSAPTSRAASCSFAEFAAGLNTRATPGASTSSAVQQQPPTPSRHETPSAHNNASIMATPVATPSRVQLPSRPQRSSNATAASSVPTAPFSLSPAPSRVALAEVPLNQQLAPAASLKKASTTSGSCAPLGGANARSQRIKAMVMRCTDAAQRTALRADPTRTGTCPAQILVEALCRDVMKHHAKLSSDNAGAPSAVFDDSVTAKEVRTVARLMAAPYCVTSDGHATQDLSHAADFSILIRYDAFIATFTPQMGDSANHISTAHRHEGGNGKVSGKAKAKSKSVQLQEHVDRVLGSAGDEDASVVFAAPDSDSHQAAPVEVQVAPLVGFHNNSSACAVKSALCSFEPSSGDEDDTAPQASSTAVLTSTRHADPRASISSGWTFDHASFGALPPSASSRTASVASTVAAPTAASRSSRVSAFSEDQKPKPIAQQRQQQQQQQQQLKAPWYQSGRDAGYRSVQQSFQDLAAKGRHTLSGTAGASTGSSPPPALAGRF